jgi:hypothetical protein
MSLIRSVRKKLMLRVFRCGLIFSMIVAAGVLLALFGRYPSAGIPEDTVTVSVRRSASDTPIVSLTEADELREAKNTAGTIWNHIGYNSLDDPELYRLTLTRRDGQTTSFWITPAEWSDHGKTPGGFIQLLKQKQTE